MQTAGLRKRVMAERGRETREKGLWKYKKQRERETESHRERERKKQREK